MKTAKVRMLEKIAQFPDNIGIPTPRTVNGVPAKPGDVFEVTEARARALTGHGWAELFVEAPSSAAEAGRK
jgi:hypothetical protein